MNKDTDTFERENADNIVGWEIQYQEKISDTEWKKFPNYRIIIFKMKDGSKVEFKVLNYE